ncbi:MAG: DUF2071 domain-containing protein [Saprospiraceae bacterium]|nr:DUF2071 domain-containing protein [Saprospiraceae bacterium]
MQFLTAEWRNLVMANYAVDPGILQPFVPAYTELDTWQDRCYVSLVGFLFLNTRIKGVRIPFHQSFEEVNLRFYVQRRHQDAWRRGTVFIRELVPRPLVSMVANTLFGEHYRTTRMAHELMVQGNQQKIAYRWQWKRRWHALGVTAATEAVDIPAESEAEFITEHYWGYTGLGPGRTTEYAVQHPRWQVYPVLDYSVETDFAALYGQAFSVLNGSRPTSVLWAAGSPVSVEHRQRVAASSQAL